VSLLGACAAPTTIPTGDPGLGERAPESVPTDGSRALDVAIEHEGKAVAGATPGGLPGVRMMLGLTAAEVTTLLGPPKFLRRDAPAEIWQYGAEACVLDLFLYQDPATKGVYRVRYAAVRGDSVVRAHEQACLAILFGKKPD
ncbi:MAG: hypothetical protein OQJ87_09020, partial [Rhodospirillales bacterium]|nr:hypothetical protein [Rhodospirillales bacterium]